MITLDDVRSAYREWDRIEAGPYDENAWLEALHIAQEARSEYLDSLAEGVALVTTAKRPISLTKSARRPGAYQVTYWTETMQPNGHSEYTDYRKAAAELVDSCIHNGHDLETIAATLAA